MTWHMKRRACGLALGLCVSWNAAPMWAGDEPKLVPAGNAQPAEAADDEVAARVGDVEPTVEKVTERFPNRTVKIERYVAQDETGNYFDHGPFARWNEDGRLMGRGQYAYGRLEGAWVRWFTIEETETIYADLLARGFEAPFTSQADFEHGRLHGAWTIVDAQKREVCAWEFEHGKRHGVSRWWFPDGEKFREVEYRMGDIDGAVRQWDADGKLVFEETYVHGYRHGVKTEYYDSGEIKSECETLFAKDVLIAVDDWWKGTTEVTSIGKSGTDQRHGSFKAWNREGQKILEGRYVDDLPDGKFTWWYDNGTKAIEGQYAGGKQDGTWTWWYENGMKEISGEYVLGAEGGRWRSWSSDGRVAETLQLAPNAANDKLMPVELPPSLGPQSPAAKGDVSAVRPQPPEGLQPVNYEERQPSAPQPEAEPVLKQTGEAKAAAARPTLRAPIVRAAGK